MTDQTGRPLGPSLAALMKEYRPSMTEDVLRAWAADVHRTLAAGKVAPVAWMLLGKDSGEGTRYVSLTLHADTAERYKGELEVVPLYTAPAKASEPEYDRSLIADMLESAIGQRNEFYVHAAIAEQARLLRAADNADAAKVRTAKASGSAPQSDEVLIAIKRGEAYEDVHPQLVAEDALRQTLHGGCQFEWRVVDVATPPASAPSEPFGYIDSRGELAHAGNSTNFRRLLDCHRAGKPRWRDLKLLYLAPPASAPEVTEVTESPRMAFERWFRSNYEYPEQADGPLSYTNGGYDDEETQYKFVGFAAALQQEGKSHD